MLNCLSTLSLTCLPASLAKARETAERSAAVATVWPGSSRPSSAHCCTISCTAASSSSSRREKDIVFSS